MGLFSTLAASTKDAKGSDGANANDATTSTVTSKTIPTIVQLYADSNGTPLQLNSTAKVSGYTAMTYQAIQVAENLVNPDLGIWNCSVQKESTTSTTPLIDLLLRIPKEEAKSFVMTIDLTKHESTIEPTVSLLQDALLRHFAEENNTNAAVAASSSLSAVATTSLYALKSTQFGVAMEDKSKLTRQEPNDTDKDIKIPLMICAILPTVTDFGTEQTDSAYKQKQAQALLLYHLRKYAYALNATLCFVSKASTTASKGDESKNATPAAAEAANDPSAPAVKEQPTMSLEDLAILWRDFAMNKEIIEPSEVGEPQQASPTEGASDEASPETTTTANTATTTALYGPGRHQEDLIDSVLLRNAQFPGHWDANKDSLWVALPTKQDTKTKDAATDSSKVGDGGWLTELRDSVASAVDTSKTATPPKTKEATPKEKDAAVSSFFESLLKNP